MMALGTQTMLGNGAPPRNGPPAAPPRSDGPQLAGPCGRRCSPKRPGGRPRAGTAQLDDVFRERLRSTGMKDETINGALERFVPGLPTDWSSACRR